MQTIVTGGAGFIGRNLVARLNEKGNDNIIIVDNLGSSEKWKNLVGLKFDDYIDKKDFIELVDKGAFGDIDAVFHLGACSATTERDANYLMSNNFHYTRTLCNWALWNDIKFIYASSAATYGDGNQGYDDDMAKMQELIPLNMYGYSKHLFDLTAMKNGWFDKIAGLKYFNVYGPHESHKGDMRSLINKSYPIIKETRKVKLFKSHHPDYADGEQLRDFVYVKDAVEETINFYENMDVSGLFNCGTGTARSWNDLIKALFSAMNIDPDIEYVDMPEALKGKYQYFTEANMSKIRATGFNHKFMSIEDGVKDYVNTYLSKEY
ncbi:MAG: ADP-glyceromanno-heptose 6-epimerase [Kiritimatiellae bacterium]|jgi:ADP-L-glycero-D-manno-heptose 6-epimerase|nr:ADP-glyceromanno-heptose 6-epimerase [Kiritimatiellia bacterium]